MLPDKTFDGRVGIITGGATGIGFGFAREIARLGGRVVLASRKEENLSKAVEQIRSETGRGDAAHFHVLDVRDAEAVEGMAAKVESVASVSSVRSRSQNGCAHTATPPAAWMTSIACGTVGRLRATYAAAPGTR